MRSKVLIGILLAASACLEPQVQPNGDDQLVKDVKAIDDYLAAHPGSPTDVIIKDASGVRLVITTLGTGTIPPNPGNTLKIAYTGRLLANGAIFDSNENYIVKLSDNIINGWKIGISLLTKGAQAKLYIPSSWGYGSAPNGTIPANANLVFDINLIEVTPTQTQQDKLAADINTIDAYLTSNSITAQTHSSGIRYVVTQTGSGPTPTLYDAVRVNMRATTLNEGTELFNRIFEPNADFSSRVVNYPHGVLVALQLLPEGGKATVYVPSTLVTGLQNVTSGANVVFEVELLAVL